MLISVSLRLSYLSLWTDESWLFCHLFRRHYFVKIFHDLVRVSVLRIERRRVQSVDVAFGFVDGDSRAG